MSMQNEAPYHHGNLKSALIDAAFKLLDTQNHEAVTVRGVARMAGVSHAAPVNHFKDRAALLTQLATLTFDEIAKTLNIAGSLDQSDILKSIVERYEAFAIERPNRYRLMWRCELLDTTSPHLALAGQNAYLALEAALRNSGVDSLELEVATSGLWALMHGHVSLTLDGAFGDVLPNGAPAPTLWQLVQGTVIHKTTTAAVNAQLTF